MTDYTGLPTEQLIELLHEKDAFINELYNTEGVIKFINELSTNMKKDLAIKARTTQKGFKALTVFQFGV